MAQHYISNHFLQHYSMLNQQQSIDTTRLVNQVGLPIHVLRQEYCVIPLQQFVQLLTVTREHSRGRAIALVLAKQQDISIFGALIPKLAQCHTVAMLLNVLQTYIQSIIPGLQIQQQQHVDNIMIQFTHSDRTIMANIAFCEYAISFAYHLLQQVIAAPVAIRSIFFPFNAPQQTQVQRYQDLFHCPIAFAQPSLSLCFHPDILNYPTKNIAAALQHKISAERGAGEPLHEQVADLISVGLASGNISIEWVAQALALTPRTLQRRLTNEKYGYSEILAEVRQGHAKQFLGSTDYDLVSIAFMLGYKHLATFSRECKLWFGQTPTQLRKTLMQQKTPTHNKNTGI